MGGSALLPLLPAVSFCEESILPGGKNKAHRIMCCNIRVALDEDEQKGVGWSKRKHLCIDTIRKQKPDIICLQEVLKIQSEDFQKAFPSFQLLGFDGPEMDAHKEGYHGIAKNPVLFDSSRYILLNAGTYWLSETPLIGGSKSWDTARARHVNWVRLKDKISEKEFRVINLHLDHISETARQQQVKLALQECNQYQNDFPQFLAGDFNAKATGEVVSLVKSHGWKDAHFELNGFDEEEFTVHEFKGLEYSKKKEKGKIDFLFYKGKVKPVSSKIITDNKAGKYPSDHFFLSTELEFE